VKGEFTEGVRVSIVGATGFVTSYSLTEFSSLVSIAVGLATLVYIVAKTIFLIRNKGREPK
jgi:hypothetical protein